MTTRKQKHDYNAEFNFEQRFLHTHYKSALQSKRQGHKLYSKVLTSKPFRLLQVLTQASLNGKQNTQLEASANKLRYGFAQ